MGIGLKGTDILLVSGTVFTEMHQGGCTPTLSRKVLSESPVQYLLLVVYY